MTPNILANQLRAARAWLNWSRDDLAEKAGVVSNTIAAIEKGDGASEPNARTMAKILGAFTTAGVEITDEGGVRPRVSTVSYFTGASGFKKFLDDVYNVIKIRPDADVCIANNDDSLFLKWTSANAAAHVERVNAIDPKPRYRALIKETDTNVGTSTYCEFRYISKDEFADTCVYIYGDKTAFIDFEEDAVTVTLVDSTKVSSALRRMFETSWKNGRPVH
jgi:DNA-binding XRE family transcriptional regulator